MVKEARESKASKCMFMTSKRKQVMHADTDIGRLSQASCEVTLNVMSDEVENDWIEVERGRRSGRNQQAIIRADHVEGPTESESCR